MQTWSISVECKNYDIVSPFQLEKNQCSCKGGCGLSDQNVIYWKIDNTMDQIDQ